MAIIQKGDVLIVDLSAGIGHEQRGMRPAIAVSLGNLPSVVVVVPLTSNMESLRFPHTLAVSPDPRNGLKQESVALVFQMRAIDKKRVTHVVGKLDAASRKKFDSELKRVLRLS